MNEAESGGAELCLDEDTGQPFWDLWGAGWKGGDALDPNQLMELSPRAFPVGTRVVIVEPGPDATQDFYRAALDGRLDDYWTQQKASHESS
jgi:hypothetical protein